MYKISKTFSLSRHFITINNNNSKTIYTVTMIIIHSNHHSRPSSFNSHRNKRYIKRIKNKSKLKNKNIVISWLIVLNCCIRRLLIWVQKLLILNRIINTIKRKIREIKKSYNSLSHCIRLSFIKPTVSERWETKSIIYIFVSKIVYLIIKFTKIMIFLLHFIKFLYSTNLLSILQFIRNTLILSFLT